MHARQLNQVGFISTRMFQSCCRLHRQISKAQHLCFPLRQMWHQHCQTEIMYDSFSFSQYQTTDGSGGKGKKESLVVRIDLTFLIWELGKSQITPKISPIPLKKPSVPSYTETVSNQRSVNKIWLKNLFVLHERRALAHRSSPPASGSGFNYDAHPKIT